MTNPWIHLDIVFVLHSRLRCLWNYLKLLSWGKTIGIFHKKFLCLPFKGRAMCAPTVAARASMVVSAGLELSLYVCPRTSAHLCECLNPTRKATMVTSFSAGCAQGRPRAPRAQSQHIHKSIKQHIGPFKMCRTDIKTMWICIQQIITTCQTKETNISCDNQTCTYQK